MAMELYFSLLRSLAEKFLYLVISALSIVLLYLVSNIALAGNAVTVIYPVYHNDTDKIISEIREGINANRENNISEIPYDYADTSVLVLKRLSSLSKDEIVITLTDNLEAIIRTSGFKGQLIDGVSGNLASTKSTIRVGIEPSPIVYIDTVAKVSPQLKKIVYFTSINESKNNEILEDKITSSNNIGVKVIHVENIDDAMHKISDVIAHYDPAETAIWIPSQVFSMSNNTVLKYVLREAWRRSFIVFTDSLEAVARGLLFSLIPDYRAYGVYLSKLASNIPAGDHTPVF